MRVLLVEDHADLAANIVDSLAARGHVVEWSRNGLAGLQAALTGAFDAMVLDLGLPWMDGLELCARLRRESRAYLPVLMLTARDDLDTKVAGFEAGADDYLVKPFAMAELEARLRAIVRRHGEPPSAGERLQVADLVFDLATRRVERAGRVLHLAPASQKLLARLMRDTARVVPRAELERELWGDDPPDGDALRAHVHVLRAAIDRPFDKPLLQTIHGIGYRLCDPAAL